MLPSTICLRCRSRLLQRSFQSSVKQAHDSVPLYKNNAPSQIEQNQDDIVLLKQEKLRQGHKPQWQAPRPEKGDVENIQDSMKSLLDGLFDSNRHETPKSSIYRYSRRPIQQQSGQQPQVSNTTNNESNASGRASTTTLSSYSTGLVAAGYKKQDVRSDKVKDIASSSAQDTTENSTTKSRLVSIKIRRTPSGSIGPSSKRHDHIFKPTSTRTGSSAPVPMESNFDAKSVQEVPDFHEAGEEMSSSTLPGLNELLAEIEPNLAGAQVLRKLRHQTNQAQNDGLDFQRLRSLVLNDDIRSTNELWRRFRKAGRLAKFTKIELDTLFADFLWSFGQLRKMEPLMEVWSCMGKHGITPKVRHWNAVLKILQRNREMQRFQAIWQDMLGSGTKPNKESWTIHAELLLAQPCHDWRAAMQLLDTMGRSWREAQAEQASSNIQPEYLPSIEPVNATLTGLLRLHLVAAAIDVFKWARSFPVEIDMTCYNIFIRYVCENGDNAGIASILKDMESKGVKQDVVTKTTILDSILRNPNSEFNKLSLAEQERFAIEKLNKMTDEGTPPNSQTFAVALEALLLLPTPNLTAAQAVFQMSRQTGHVSPQIYTIFLMHHLNQESIDLDAIESLWSEVAAQKTKIDHVLYDRMIEGYAIMGQLERMLALFRKMTANGHSPGWWALGAALTALVKVEAWQLCAQLVADVTNEVGLLHVGKRGWRGEQEFRQLVSDLQEQKLIPVKKIPQI